MERARPARSGLVRRLAGAALVLVLSLAGVVGIAVLTRERDEPSVARQEAAGPGTAEPDRGSGHGRAAGPAGDRLPTSGPHRPEPVRRGAGPLPTDALLHALELGDVVLVHPGRRPPPTLRRLAEEVAGPFDPALAAAGAAVLLVPAPDGAGGVEALAWRRRLRVDDPRDPRLAEFAEAWLGRGAPGR